MPELVDFIVWSQNRDVIGCWCAPDELTPDTGFMLVVHGHGNSRFQYRDTMMDFARRYNVICISPEYRDSGRDSGVGERGSREPYDFSHLQVADTLNCLRKAKLAFPQCDLSRTFAWGGSQGGMIVMLAAEFAPKSFALTVEACGISDVTGRVPGKKEWVREGAEGEIRSPILWVDRVANKVFIFHGTADDVVVVDQARALEEALRKAGKEFEAYYTEGGKHFLEPVTSREAETIKHCGRDLRKRRLAVPDDFELESEYVFECTGATCAASFKGGWFTLTATRT
jgi:predicted esterase